MAGTSVEVGLDQGALGAGLRCQRSRTRGTGPIEVGERVQDAAAGRGRTEGRGQAAVERVAGADSSGRSRHGRLLGSGSRAEISTERDECAHIQVHAGRGFPPDFFPKNHPEGPKARAHSRSTSAGVPGWWKATTAARAAGTPCGRGRIRGGRRPGRSRGGGRSRGSAGRRGTAAAAARPAERAASPAFGVRSACRPAASAMRARAQARSKASERQSRRRRPAASNPLGRHSFPRTLGDSTRRATIAPPRRGRRESHPAVGFEAVEGAARLEALDEDLLDGVVELLGSGEMRHRAAEIGADDGFVAAGEGSRRAAIASGRALDDSPAGFFVPLHTVALCRVRPYQS